MRGDEEPVLWRISSSSGWAEAFLESGIAISLCSNNRNKKTPAVMHVVVLRWKLCVVSPQAVLIISTVDMTSLSWLWALKESGSQASPCGGEESDLEARETHMNWCCRYTSRSSTSLPVIGSDSWVHLGRGRVLIHRGVPLARSARYPIRPQSDLSLFHDTNNSSVVVLWGVLLAHRTDCYRRMFPLVHENLPTLLACHEQRANRPYYETQSDYTHHVVHRHSTVSKIVAVSIQYGKMQP